MWILAIFIGFIGPLIFFIIAKDKPFVYRHSAQALALQIVVAVSYIVAMILMVVLIGLLLLPVVGLFHLIICIMGAMAANKGDEYDPPLTSALAKSLFKV